MMRRDDDDLRALRGILNGFGLSLLLWAGAVGLYLLFTRF